jgi:hypothetical protein
MEELGMVEPSCGYSNCMVVALWFGILDAGYEALAFGLFARVEGFVVGGNSDGECDTGCAGNC